MEAKEVVLAVADDLILEILLRLPPVSVLKFKCVCKLWYSLISNPCFLRNHARQFHLLQRDPRRRLDPPGFLLSPIPFRPVQVVHPVYAIPPQDQDQDQDELPFPPLLKVCLDHSLPSFHKKCSSPWICAFDSCNGLLLYHSIYSKETKVFNPITNQYTEIPIMDLFPSFSFKEHTIRTKNCILLCILFDPSISPSFKILTCLRCLIETPDSPYELHVYSSDTRSWRLITSFGKEYGSPMKTFMFDGVFYWLKNDASICFDFVKESVWFLPLPPIPVGYHHREVLYFGECGGHLRLIEEYYGSSGNQGRWFPYSFDIMEKELGSTIWTVKTRVNIEAGYDHLILGKDDPYDHDVVRVMHLYQTEKGEEVVLLNVDDRRLVTFNLTTNTFGKELTIPCFEHYEYLNAFPFTPTLFPLLT